MDYGGLAQLLIATGTLITAAVTALISWKTSNRVEEVRHQTNSLKDELVHEVRKAATLKGNLEGRAELKEEREDVSGKAS